MNFQAALIECRQSVNAGAVVEQPAIPVDLKRAAELARTAIDYPPMRDPASSTLDAINKIDEAIRHQPGQ